MSLTTPVLLQLVEGIVEILRPGRGEVNHELTVPLGHRVVLQDDLDLVGQGDEDALAHEVGLMDVSRIDLLQLLIRFHGAPDPHLPASVLLEEDEGRAVVVGQEGALEDTVNDDRLTRSNIDTTHVVLSISHVIGWLGPLLETIQQACQESRGGFPPPLLGLSCQLIDKNARFLLIDLWIFFRSRSLSCLIGS